MSTYTSYLAKALVSAGADVRTIGFGHKNDHIGAANLVGYESIGGDPAFLDWCGGVSTTYAYVRARLRRAFHQNPGKEDVLHFVYPGAAIRPPSRAKVITSAWSFSTPGEIIGDANHKFSGIWKGLGMAAGLQFYHMDRKGYRNSDGVVCTTSEAKRFWNRRVETRMMYIPPAIEVPAEPSFRTDSDSSNNRINFLAAERNLERPIHDIFAILSAFRRLQREGRSDFRLFLIGGFTSRLATYVANLVREGMSITLLPYMQRVSYLKLLESTDVFISLRFVKDQAGYAILEAMARGIPAVASNLPAFSDFVIPGVNGLLSDPVDSRVIAETLRAMLDDRASLRKMGEAARAFMIQNHSCEVVGREHLRFYETILASSGKRTSPT
jgi:glycosyltransferase involved in cell wall biosynthesis